MRGEEWGVLRSGQSDPVPGAQITKPVAKAPWSPSDVLAWSHLGSGTLGGRAPVQPRRTHSGHSPFQLRPVLPAGAPALGGRQGREELTVGTRMAVCGSALHVTEATLLVTQICY